MRDNLVIVSVATVLIAAGVASYLYGKTPAPAAVQTAIVDTVPVSFEEITRGEKSQVTKSVNYIITSEVELNKLWTMLDAEGVPPSIDFKENSVVAVFAGQQETEGYTVSVTKIEDSSQRMVTITLNKPGASCLPTKSDTQSYQIIKVLKTALPMAHEDVTTTESCLN